MNQMTDFIIRELWIMAWAASVQRANLYKKGNENSKKDLFRKKIIDYLSSDIIPEYKNDVLEPKHYNNIEKLIEVATHNNFELLSEDGYKYGVAQKLLNLALKYYWCLGLIKEPPHCPVDRVVIDSTIYKGKINWTQIKQKPEYQKIIEEIKRLAQNQNLSVPLWELSIYNRRRLS